jgi:hypothetical protein
MAKSKKWYGVKTVYRATASGAPRSVGHLFDTTVTLVEERVVLMCASTSDEAIRRAEADAARYCHGTHLNPYGQRVRYKYLGECSAFELFDAPADGREVFSQTEVISKDHSDAEIRAWHFSRETRRQSLRRRNILNAEFSG